jgi:hypothetical protein
MPDGTINDKDGVLASRPSYPPRLASRLRRRRMADQIEALGYRVTIEAAEAA